MKKILSDFGYSLVLHVNENSELRDYVNYLELHAFQSTSRVVLDDYLIVFFTL